MIYDDKLREESWNFIEYKHAEYIMHINLSKFVLGHHYQIERMIMRRKGWLWKGKEDYETKWWLWKGKNDYEKERMIMKRKGWLW